VVIASTLRITIAPFGMNSKGKEDRMQNILHQIQEDKQLQYLYEVNQLYHAFFYYMIMAVQDESTLTQQDVQREIKKLLDTRNYLADIYLHPIR
jgi:hypothetical protein